MEKRLDNIKSTFLIRVSVDSVTRGSVPFLMRKEPNGCNPLMESNRLEPVLPLIEEMEPVLLRNRVGTEPEPLPSLGTTIRETLRCLSI